MTRHGRIPPSLVTRAEEIDIEQRRSTPKLGTAQQGYRCQALLCDQTATRLAEGEWRCEACADPRPLEISGEFGRAWGDPRRRWRTVTYAVSRTQRETTGEAGESDTAALPPQSAQEPPGRPDTVVADAEDVPAESQPYPQPVDNSAEAVTA